MTQRTRPAFASLLATVLPVAALAVGTVVSVPAVAASRLVVLPVVVGGTGEPEAGLVAALTEGLKQNPQYGVEQGDALVTLAKFSSVSLTDADLARLGDAVDQAAKKAGGEAADAATSLAAAREELRAAARKGPRGAKGDELAWRASTLLVNALVASKQEAKARTVAEETLLLFPGRKASEADKLSPKATELLAALPANLGAKLTLRTRPEGCEVLAGDVVLGKDPLEIAVLQGDGYHFHARCPAAAGATAGAPIASHPKRVIVPASETTRQEVLDAEFERGFQAEGLRRIRFATTQDRRQLEESYARRIAERFDADAIVLASVGELSGADWLNARLYLRSGYLNRQGLVRLEPQRANALGRFLATGKDVPGVLKPEDAGNLLSSSRVSSNAEPAVAPWYSDVVGWTFLGAGIVVTSVGLWGNASYEKQQEEAETLRGDMERQDRLFREAQQTKFWSGIATVGGILFAVTGGVLLAVPEYADDSAFMAIRPNFIPGGGGLTLGGRF